MGPRDWKGASSALVFQYGIATTEYSLFGFYAKASRYVFAMPIHQSGDALLAILLGVLLTLLMGHPLAADIHPNTKGESP